MELAPQAATCPCLASCSLLRPMMHAHLDANETETADTALLCNSPDTLSQCVLVGLRLSGSGQVGRSSNEPLGGDTAGHSALLAPETLLRVLCCCGIRWKGTWPGHILPRRNGRGAPAKSLRVWQRQLRNGNGNSGGPQRL